jgi:enoyl-CoA hydratase
MLTGRTTNAAEAERMGVVSPGRAGHQLLKTAYTLAEALIANNAVSIALTKPVLHANVDAPARQTPLDLHSLNQALITATGAAREALTSFQRT